MNNNRMLMILLVVLVAMGGLYLASRDRRPHMDETGGFVDLVEGALSTDDVYGMEVRRGTDVEQGFTLAKRGDDWVVPSKYDATANVNKLRTLLTSIEGASGELRSDDGSVLAGYGLADTSAVHMILKKESGDPMLHMLLGKRTGQSSLFVRKDGSNEVYVTKTNLLSNFGVWNDDTDPDAKQWLDLEAFKVERDSIAAIRVEGSEHTLALNKEFDEPDSTAVAATPAVYEWRVTEPDNFMALKTRGDGIMGSVALVRAQDVAAPPADLADYGLGDAAQRVTVTTASGQSTTLLFGGNPEDAENSTYFQVEGEDRIWIIGSYLSNNIFKTPDDLRPDES